MDNLEVKIENNTLYLKGEVTKFGNLSGQSLEKLKISDVLQSPEKELLEDIVEINLHEVHKIDTTGIAVLMQWMRELHKLNKSIKFTEINENIDYAFKLYGVSNVFA